MDLQLNSTNASTLPPNLNRGIKVLWSIAERSTGRSYWTRVGTGFLNRDGSINIRLDAIPLSGNLQLRDWSPRDVNERAPEAEGRTESRPPTGDKRSSDIPF